MSLTINTNLEALNASRNLNATENTLSQTMQRLSSGLRINSAADDVAGYAISQSLQAQVNGLNQAGENIQDAVALAQTAQGALNDVNGMLQRIRELGVEYANGTTSEEDQEAIISEVKQLTEEIKRVGETTQFNGKDLLNADEEISFQVGANDGEKISVKTIELYKEIEKFVETKTLGERLGGSEGAAKLTKAEKEAIAKEVEEEGLTLSAEEKEKLEEKGELKTVAEAETEVEAGTEATEWKEEEEAAEITKLEYEEKVTEAAETQVKGEEKPAIEALEAKAVEKAEEKALEKLEGEGGGATKATGLKEIDEAIAKVSSLAGEFGSVQDRIQYTQANLEVYSQNLTSAVSALDDVNMATEMTNFTKDQVLQQAGVSILTQANQLPDAILHLLEG
ncbi:MAG TPA: flagellin [Solirubrobacteraceae bacterium]|nr:flagellin [Solirubrobacteraceae bacterium]